MFYRIKKLIGRISPRAMSALMHKRMLGRWPHIAHPVDFNEKILYIMHYTDTDAWAPLADKLKVRDFVAEKGYSQMLIPLLGAWDKADDIDFSALVPPYVLKANNGSGEVIIVESNDALNAPNFRQRVQNLLDITYFYATGETHYRKIQPKIIAEAMLNPKRQSFKSSSLIDYKIFCFDGLPELIEVVYDRHGQHAKAEIKSIDWKDRQEMMAGTGDIAPGDGRAARPASLSKMLDAAKALSAGFPFVRVDMYEVDGQPYFGELTFTPGAGASRTFTRKALLQLGEKLKLTT